MSRSLGMASIAIALAIAPALDAQATVDSVALHPARGVQVGQKIRVALLGTRHAGQVRRMERDTIFLGAAGQPTGIRIDAIDTLWRRSSFESVGSNVGMVTLGLLGAAAVVAVYVGSAESGQSVSASEWGTVALGAVAGTAVGWFTGALVGSAFPRWRRVYPR